MRVSVKIIITIFLFISLLAVMSDTIYADDRLIESGWCGNSVSYSIYLKSGTSNYYVAILNGTGPTYNYTLDNESPLMEKKINEVRIGEGITAVGDRLFQFNSIKKISFPSTLTRIGSFAFEYAYITSLKIPKGVKSIGSYAFTACYKLKKIVIPGTVKTIGAYAFQGDTKVEKISLGKGIKSVKKYGLSDLNKVTSISVPDSVTSVGAGAFAYNRRMKTIKLSKKIRKIPSKAFENCMKLKTIKITSKKAPKLAGKSVFRYVKTKRITIRCAKMSGSQKRIFRKRLKKIGFKGKVR